MSNATVDALGMCLATSLYWYGLLRQAISLISVWGKCTHIGVGFDVARSTILGNAKASISGTSNEEIPRFPFNLSTCLWVTNEFIRIMNTYKKVTLFFVSFVLCFVFCSCSNDGDENNMNSTSNEKKLVKITYVYGSWESTTSFNYDKQGRLLVVENKDSYSRYIYSYIWSDDKVVQKDGNNVVELRIVDGLARSGSFECGNDKKDVSLLYNSNSRLLSYDFGYDYNGSITWGKNGISQASNLEGEIIYSGKTCKGYNPYIVYHVSSSPFEDFAVAQPSLFGLNDNHLPDRIKGDNDEFSFSYKFDNEGYLVELAATYHGNSNKDYEDGMTEYYKYTWE